ncbi:MAG: MraY family glycosyltransferase [Tissierellia bacterium]|nr:MraY family glycosyltransferase [Tissierellia bacterium]
MQYLILPFALAVFIALLATPAVRKWSLHYNVMDLPGDKRRVHKKPIPLAGGLAIYLALISSSLIFLPLSRGTLGYIVGATIIVLTGLYDDKYNMAAKTKFALQIVAALALILIGDVNINFFTNPFYGQDTLISLEAMSLPITLFWMVGITNTINLIDGLDGLATGISMIAAISLMLIAHRFSYLEIAVLSAILAGGCLGFLPYNFNPAKIFLGDTGALLLGFSLSFIAVEGVMKSAAILTILLPVLILGVPIFDTTFAMIRRKMAGRSIVSPDKGHLHHRLLHRGLSQRQTVLALYLVTAIFGLIANLISQMNAKNGLITSIIIVGGIGILALMLGLLHDKEDES